MSTPADPATVATPESTPQETPAAVSIPAQSPEARLEQLLAQEAAMEKAAGPAVDTEKPAAAIPAIETPEATATDAPEIVAADESAQTPAPERDDKGRFTATEPELTDEENEAVALAKAFRKRGEEVPSFSERIEMVKARRTVPAVPQEQPSEYDAAIAAKKVELEAVRSKADEVNESLGTKEARDLARAELKTERDLAELESRKAQSIASAQSERAKFRTERSAAIAAAQKNFPSAADANSRLGQALTAEIAKLNSEVAANPDHPMAEAMKTADVPLYIVKTVAKRVATQLAKENGTTVSEELLALGPQQKTQTAPAATPAKAKPAKPVLAGAAASSAPLSAAAAKPLTLRSLSQMSLEELEALQPSPRGSHYMIS